MNFKAAMDEASRRAVANNEAIDVWFNADSQALDWRDRYLACRSIDRPAHGRLACTAQPDGTFITHSQTGRALEARPPATPRRREPKPDAPVIHDEPYTDFQAVSRLALRVADLLNTALDADHVWHYAGIQAEHYSKPSGLHDENGFAIDLMYLERDKRVVVSAGFAHDLYRHRRRDDDPCRATYSPTRPARAIAADVLRRVIEPGRVLYARYLKEEDERQRRISQAIATTEQIVAASRGHIEQSRNDDPHSGEDLHLYLNRSHGLYLTGRVSTHSSGIMLERVELPLPVMLRLAAIIADDLDDSLSP